MAAKGHRELWGWQECLDHGCACVYTTAHVCHIDLYTSRLVTLTVCEILQWSLVEKVSKGSVCTKRQKVKGYLHFPREVCGECCVMVGIRASGEVYLVQPAWTEQQMKPNKLPFRSIVCPQSLYFNIYFIMNTILT